MKIATYIRISTNSSRQETDNQIIPLKEWAQRLSGEFIAEYVDEASGSKSDRKALQMLLEDARMRKFDTLLIWALDRLSREGIARMSGYLEILRSYGVRVLSHQEPWLDTSGPVSDLLIAIFGWVAQQERNRIRERVLCGLRSAKAKGKTFGRPKRNVNIEKALSYKEKGHSLREIAQFMGVPRATLARALSQKPQQRAA